MTIFAVLALFWFLFAMTFVGLSVARVARRGGSRRRHGSSRQYGAAWDGGTSSYDHGSWGLSDCGSSWSSSDGGSSSSGSSGSDSGSSCS